jgi:hypothetical protein
MAYCETLRAGWIVGGQSPQTAQPTLACRVKEPRTKGAPRMISTESELIWQGRIQLGDEPGTFTDAGYSGLSVEFPLTVRDTGASGPDAITLYLKAEHVKVFSGYPGHLVKIYYYQEGSTKFHWKQILYKDFRMTDNNLQLDIDLTKIKPPDPKKDIYLSVSVEVDTEVAPGLYNDFVLLQLKASSENYKYIANFGFDYY